jgi:Kef-type K+ transport system membrane component KefB
MMSRVKATLLSVPLAALQSMLVCTAETRVGWMSEGLDCFYAPIVSCITSLGVVAAACAVSCRRAGGLRWTSLLALTLITAISTTTAIGHVLASQLRVLLAPVQATPDLQIIRSRSILFASYMQVRCTKAWCAEVIRSKGLHEIPEDMEPKSDMTPLSARRSTQRMWDWWRPANMPGAHFYFRHHPSDAPQGWSKGIWTNAKMTEMFLFMRG